MTQLPTDTDPVPEVITVVRPFDTLIFPASTVRRTNDASPAAALHGQPVQVEATATLQDGVFTVTWTIPPHDAAFRMTDETTARRLFPDLKPYPFKAR